MLRRSEDSFIDELFSKAPNYGAPLLKATFPRAYVDPNREPFELDPTMFEDQLPDYVNTDSVKISAGLGTVARVVINGENIYRKKLKFSEIKRRVESFYFPYHQALQRLIENTRIKFGFCILIDCHSMPSIDGPMDDDTGNNRVDIVLGNNYVASCAPQLLSYTSASLKRQGLSICRNKPYSGGYTTCHYGKPDKGVHALQIEINRSLYMNETNIEKHGGFLELSDKVTRFIFDLSKFNLNQLTFFKKTFGMYFAYSIRRYQPTRSRDGKGVCEIFWNFTPACIRVYIHPVGGFSEKKCGFS